MFPNIPENQAPLLPIPEGITFTFLLWYNLKELLKDIMLVLGLRGYSCVEVDIWVVLKTMGPCWLWFIVRHLLFGGRKMGP